MAKCQGRVVRKLVKFQNGTNRLCSVLFSWFFKANSVQFKTRKSHKFKENTFEKTKIKFWAGFWDHITFHITCSLLNHKPKSTIRSNRCCVCLLDALFSVLRTKSNVIPALPISPVDGKNRVPNAQPCERDREWGKTLIL